MRLGVTAVMLPELDFDEPAIIEDYRPHMSSAERLRDAVGFLRDMPATLAG